MLVLRFSCKHPSCESFLSPEKHFSLRLTCSLFRDSGFVSDVEGFPVSPSLLSTSSCLDAHLPQLNRKIDTKRHSNNPPQFKSMCVYYLDSLAKSKNSAARKITDIEESSPMHKFGATRMELCGWREVGSSSNFEGFFLQFSERSSVIS